MTLSPYQWYAMKPQYNSMYNNQGQNTQGQQNPWLSGTGSGLEFLSGMIPTEQDRYNKWSHNQQKDQYNRIYWGHLADKPAISPEMMNAMRANIRNSLGPTRANMLYAASKNAGLRSGQTYNTYMENYLPIEAGQNLQLEQFAADRNMQMRQFWENLLARYAGA